MLARDKFQGEKDESRISIELQSDFSTAGEGESPIEILRFEQRFEVVVGISLVHIRRKNM